MISDYVQIINFLALISLESRLKVIRNNASQGCNWKDCKKHETCPKHKMSIEVKRTSFHAKFVSS